MNAAKSMKVEEIKGTVNVKPRTLLVCLAILLGGGGSIGGGMAVFDFVTEDQLKVYLEDSRNIEDERHITIDKKFAVQSADINGLKETVTDVRATQIREIARQEARRLTEGIKNREHREAEYDRLLNRNIKRLEAGRDPCVVLDCD